MYADIEFPERIGQLIIPERTANSVMYQLTENTCI